MKIPKELQRSKKKKIRERLSIKNLYSAFNQNWQKFQIMDDASRSGFINSLSSKANLKSKRPLYFYDLLKEKYDKFIDDLGFKCFRCEVNACIPEDESVGVFEEDIKLLKKNDVDKKGIIIPVVPDFYRLLKEAGYKRVLKLVNTDGIKHCYYYNMKKRECRIYPYRPLTCYLFPFLIKNKRSEVFLNCGWMTNKLKELKDLKILDEQIESFESYYEFQIAVILFLLRKGMLTSEYEC
jgi:Fe-S-cluster containining protein